VPAPQSFWRGAIPAGEMATPRPIGLCIFTQGKKAGEAPPASWLGCPPPTDTSAPRMSVPSMPLNLQTANFKELPPLLERTLGLDFVLQVGGAASKLGAWRAKTWRFPWPIAWPQPVRRKALRYLKGHFWMPTNERPFSRQARRPRTQTFDDLATGRGV